MGVFDEGCMGMYNAIIDDEHLNPSGLYKERLSQSALVAEMRLVSTQEARAGYDWLRARGMRFDLGSDPATQQTEDQVLDQVRLYTAALRIADRFGCDPSHPVPAGPQGHGARVGSRGRPAHDPTGRPCGISRPAWSCTRDARSPASTRSTRDPRWMACDQPRLDRTGLDPATTLHDVRWGEQYGDDYVWVFEISGACPPRTSSTAIAGR